MTAQALQREQPSLLSFLTATDRRTIEKYMVGKPVTGASISDDSDVILTTTPAVLTGSAPRVRCVTAVP